MRDPGGFGGLGGGGGGDGGVVPLARTLKARGGHAATVLGALSALLDLPLDASLDAFVHTTARDILSAAVRMNVVGPLAAAGTIDGVFFDAVNYGYDIPETRPWGRAVVSVPDCDGRLNVSGCDALVAGTIDVAARATKLLERRATPSPERRRRSSRL